MTSFQERRRRASADREIQAALARGEVRKARCRRCNRVVYAFVTGTRELTPICQDCRQQEQP